MRSISLAYSPCPNDTFIFYALSNGYIDLEGLGFRIELHDVEHLNQACLDGQFDVSKISIAALGRLSGQYRLLRAGNALGRGCGPLIVGQPGASLSELSHAEITVPGTMTTANLLLSLYAKRPLQTVSMTFDRIIPAVQRGQYPFGVIIHEGRFTYQEYGLVQLLDLGQWWEENTGLPIPLGGIVIRRDLGQALAKKVDNLISKSLSYAWAHPEATRGYVRQHAQEMSHNVIMNHIHLYVNTYSLDLGQEGEAAIHTLLSMGADIGLFPSPPASLMAY